MTPGPLHVALVGSGNIATHHINAWRQTTDVLTTMVCGNIADQCKKLAEKFDMDWSTDIDAVLEDGHIDIVDIVVPSGFHAEIGIKAANAGKNVLVEKPIDVTLEKADALIKACEDNNVTLGVVSQNRFIDPMQTIYKYIEDGKLGKIIQGDAYIKWFRSKEYYSSGEWRGTYALDGGGPFINQGIHFIDLLSSIMGPAKSVYAKTKNRAHPEIEVEDMGSAIVEFKNGGSGVIQASTAMYPGLPARLEIHGTKGTACVEGDKLAFLHVEGEDPIKGGDIVAAGASDPLAIDVTPFVREFTDYVDAIKNKRRPLVDGVEARRALELILAIYESSNKGETVFLS